MRRASCRRLQVGRQAGDHDLAGMGSKPGRQGIKTCCGIMAWNQQDHSLIGRGSQPVKNGIMARKAGDHGFDHSLAGMGVWPGRLWIKSWQAEDHKLARDYGLACMGSQFDGMRLWPGSERFTICQGILAWNAWAHSMMSERNGIMA